MTGTPAWSTAKKRNEETGLDADGRFLQNLSSLAADFGLRSKLLEVGVKSSDEGVVIDLTRDAKGGLMVSLNTDSDAPVKPGRSAAAKIAPEPSQSRQKATGGKSKAKTATKRKTPRKASVTPRKATDAK